MAVCDPDGGMHSMWKGALAEHVFAPTPGVDAGMGSKPSAPVRDQRTTSRA